VELSNPRHQIPHSRGSNGTEKTGQRKRNQQPKPLQPKSIAFTEEFVPQVTVAIWRHGIALNYAAVAFAPAGVGLPEAELERLRRPLPPGNAVARDERPRSFRV
jgi:hypothetical protein